MRISKLALTAMNSKDYIRSEVQDYVEAFSDSSCNRIDLPNCDEYRRCADRTQYENPYNNNVRRDW